jgi:hypothetical protein
MKYLCLIYCEEKKVEAMPAQILDGIVDECIRYGDTLRQNDQLIASQRLQSVRTATTLRMVDGRVAVTDGPFAETKEQLGGFYFIEAKDHEEAISIASKIPPGRLGCIEVRPVWEHPG